MPETLAEAFEYELEQALTRHRERDAEAAYGHLARAHILGQMNVRRHLRAHWWMLRVALRAGHVSELVGQVLRLTLTVPGHLVGRLPVGNTGLANVSAFQPMSVPEDLRELLERG